MKTITEQLKQAILTCGMSRGKIYRLTGVKESALSRFMHGRRGMTLKSVDKLAACLRLELRKRKD